MHAEPAGAQREAGASEAAKRATEQRETVQDQQGPRQTGQGETEQWEAGPLKAPHPAGGDLAAVLFDERGLVPVVVQDRAGGEVLMLAYANREALARTLAEGRAWFYSRSRQRLWRKGETSGNELAVREVRVDCDGDAVLYVVDPSGPACHTGERSCFHRDVQGRLRVVSPITPATPSRAAAPAALPTPIPAGAAGDPTPDATPDRADRDCGNGGTGQPGASTHRVPSGWPAKDPAERVDLAFLSRLEAVIRARRRERPAGSYTTALFAAGLPRILQKVGEEAVETVVAGGHQEPCRLVEETADLIYHLTVLLVARDVGWSDVMAELRRRAPTA